MRGLFKQKGHIYVYLEYCRGNLPFVGDWHDMTWHEVDSITKRVRSLVHIPKKWGTWCLVSSFCKNHLHHLYEVSTHDCRKARHAISVAKGNSIYAFTCIHWFLLQVHLESQNQKFWKRTKSIGNGKKKNLGSQPTMGNLNFKEDSNSYNTCHLSSTVHGSWIRLYSTHLFFLTESPWQSHLFDQLSAFLFWEGPASSLTLYCTHSQVPLSSSKTVMGVSLETEFEGSLYNLS